MKTLNISYPSLRDMFPSYTYLRAIFAQGSPNCMMMKEAITGTSDSYLAIVSVHIHNKHMLTASMVLNMRVKFYLMSLQSPLKTV